MRLNNRGLVGDLPTLSHRPRCRKLPRICTPRYQPRLALWLFLLAPSLWCSTLAVTREKRHESSISLKALFCKLACPPDVVPEKVQRIELRVSDSAWF